jgi:hypothetical protein
MKLTTLALTLTALGAVSLVGCSSSDGTATDTAPPAPTTPAGEGGSPMAAPMGGPGVAPIPGNTPGLAGGQKGSLPTSFDTAPEAVKKLFAASGGMGMNGMNMGNMGGGQGTSGPKPTPIVEGKRIAYRKDPFESLVKPVVQITPAWDYVISHRTEAPYLPPPPPQKPLDPEIDLPPLPPIPRRVAGVFYNGGIAAIIESGTPPDSVISIVQPGAEVESQIPGVGPLVVESISMENLILRARDGRSVEVKLSGLSPAVRSALSQQFSSGAAGNGGGPGMGGGMMGGMPGMGGPGAGGAGKGGGGGGGNGAPIQ